MNNLYLTGVLCRIVSITDKNNLLRVRVDVVERVKINSLFFDAENQYYVAEGIVSKLPEVDSITNDSIVRALVEKLNNLPNVLNILSKTTLNMVNKTKDAVALSYILASSLSSSNEEKQKILECEDIQELMERVVILLSGEQTKAQIEENIATTVRESAEKNQQEYFLREKLKAIKKELGETVMVAILQNQFWKIRK